MKLCTFKLNYLAFDVGLDRKRETVFNNNNNNNNNKNTNNGNLYSAGIRHVVALVAVLHHCVHQTHIKHHAKTILLMLIK